MPHIDYPNVIAENAEQLRELEKRHRYTHLFQRVRMLRLLKLRACTNLGEVADALGYSRRQCQRWWGAYTEGGLNELLVSRVDERGRQEFVTEKAWEELEEVMKEGKIATYDQARDFLAERGIEYASADSVGGLFRRRKVKLKTGRPRHQKADTEEQEAFKKVRREGKRGERGARLLLQAAEDLVLRRGALWVDQLAQKAILSQGLSPALRREAHLRVDLPLRGCRSHQRRELLALPARHG
jgi:transposase